MSESQPAWHLHNRTARLSADHVLHAQFDTHCPRGGLRDVAWCDAVRIDRLFGLSNLLDETISPVEAYVRQPDLVAHYAAETQDAVARSMYWRTDEQPLTGDDDETTLQIELLLSLTTGTLGSHPRNHLQTDFANFDGEVLVSDSAGDWQDIVLSELPRSPSQTTKPLAAEKTMAGKSKAKSAKDTLENPAASTEAAKAGIVLIRPSGRACSVCLAVYPRDLARCRLNFDTSASRLSVTFELVEEFLEKGVIRRLRSACTFLPRFADRALAHRWYQRFAKSSPPLTT